MWRNSFGMPAYRIPSHSLVVLRDYPSPSLLFLNQEAGTKLQRHIGTKKKKDKGI